MDLSPLLLWAFTAALITLLAAWIMASKRASASSQAERERLLYEWESDQSLQSGQADGQCWRIQKEGSVYATDLPTLREWIRDGRILPTDLVQRGMLSWIPVADAPPLRGLTADPDRVRQFYIDQAQSEVPALPIGTKTCPSCAEEVQAAALRCRSCGSVILDPSWARFAHAYDSTDTAHRELLWSAMDSPRREYLSNVLASAIPVGVLSLVGSPTVPGGSVETNRRSVAVHCPRCGSPALGGRSGCLILLVILLFPLGLLLLLIRPTYACTRCRFRFLT